MIRFMSCGPETVLEAIDRRYGLVGNYIGPDRTHGDMYYGDEYEWFLVMDDDEGLIGVACLRDDSKSTHISVLEVADKCRGWGTKILDEIKGLDDKITLFAVDEDVKDFYVRNGFEVDTSSPEINPLFLSWTA